MSLLKAIAGIRWTLLDQAMVSATNFLIGVVLVRLFGLEDYGIYVLLWAIVQFTQSIQNALLISPMQTIGAALELPDQSAYFKTTAWGFLVSAIFFSLIILIFAQVGNSLLPFFWRQEYLLGLCTWIIAMQLQDGMRRWQIARGNEIKAFISDVIAYPGQIAAIFYSSAAGLTLAQTILALSSLLTLSAIVGGLFSALFNGKRGMQAKTVWQLNWPSSKWLVGTALLQWLSSNYVLITAAVILGPIVTGSIRAAQNLLAITHVMFQALENIFPVKVAQKYASHGLQEMLKFVKRTGIFLLASTGAIALTALLFSESILSFLYGTATSESLQAAAWYVPIYLAVAAALPARVILRVIGQTRPIFIGYLMAATASILLSTNAATNYGTNGVMALILVASLLVLAPPYFAITKVGRNADRAHS